MAATLPNVSLPGSAAVLLLASDSSFNLTADAKAGFDSGYSLAPLCTLCCCGFLNRTLAVVFMVTLAFAIVVGNVVTLTVFVQTRQSRTPQGYLKGKCSPFFHTDMDITFYFLLFYNTTSWFIYLSAFLLE